MTEMMTAVTIKHDHGLQLANVPRPVAGPGEVLIRVAATALNRGDLLQRIGMYPPPKGASEIMGLECSGYVAACGPDVTRWKVGDAVCALLPGGGYGEYTTAHEGSCLPVPGRLTMEEAASLPETMMTVQANVFDRCQLSDGETFLVHGGSSGIGVSAIQMARLAGARVFTTAGTDEKCLACEQLGAEQAINYRQQDFTEVMNAVGGVDVVLDMVGGDYVQKNVDILKVDGRIVNIAFQNGAKVEVDLLRLMLKRGMLAGSTLRARANAEKSSIRERLEARFWPAVEAGTINPVVDQVFPLAEVEVAHERMKSSAHIGKIILKMAD